MCGNFGLLLVREPEKVANETPPFASMPSTFAPSVLDTVAVQDTTEERNNATAKALFTPTLPRKSRKQKDDLDRSLNESMHTVSMLQGIRCMTEPAKSNEAMLHPLQILEAQTACTEIRGGQAGGFSSIEYKYETTRSRSKFDALFNDKFVEVPICHRVRLVARKRHPLAAELAEKYQRNRSSSQIAPTGPLSVICHTRFATSSANIEMELHPHEWVPFHSETVWLFNSTTGRFMRSIRTVGIHITHNGDFDELDAYSQVLVNAELGQWLERVLYARSTALHGDSPKIAGMMDLLRVQGRWAAAARLAWVRCVCKSPSDVADGDQLHPTAPNTFPPPEFWEKWRQFLDLIWQKHVNNVIKVISASSVSSSQLAHYCIDYAGVKQLVESITQQLEEGGHIPPQHQTFRQRQAAAATGSNAAEDELGVYSLSRSVLRGFIHHCVRGFLYCDLYNALTEFMSRAHGSFGIQVHSTMEPGVVVIASKGQPMSISFDRQHPIVLFGSEAEALAVPVFQSGKWLSQRLDLDSKGEIVRIGLPRCLHEGTFEGHDDQHQQKHPSSSTTTAVVTAALSTSKGGSEPLLLQCGIEIRSYSLITHTENKSSQLLHRTVQITNAPLPYDPKIDLVAKDLEITPAVLAAIDRAWNNLQSLESISGRALAAHLVDNMKIRSQLNHDTTDLLIGGVEASLWLAEQFAADLRRIFPNLNVVATSANKLLGFGDQHPNQVFFPVADEIQPRRIDKRTCVLLISQSGQTFSTLHATRRLARVLPDRLWILTGCFNSKMEQVLQERYEELGWYYCRDRVLNNYSGHRPAEPSSVAVAAAWHTLTRLMMQIVKTCRLQLPGGRIVHPWEYERAALVIQVYSRGFMERQRLKRLTTGASTLRAADLSAHSKNSISSMGSANTFTVSTSAAAAAVSMQAVSNLDRSTGKASCQSISSYEEARSDTNEYRTAVSIIGGKRRKILSPGELGDDDCDFEQHVQYAETGIALREDSDDEWAMHSLGSHEEQQHQHRALNPSSLQDPMGNTPTIVKVNTNKASVALAYRKRHKVARMSNNKAYVISGAYGSRAQNAALMRLTDGCIADIDALLSESFLPTIEAIVGHDVAGRKLVMHSSRSIDGQSRHSVDSHGHALPTVGRSNSGGGNNGAGVFKLISGWWDRWNDDTEYPNITTSLSRQFQQQQRSPAASKAEQQRVEEESIHGRLVAQGRAWADHINEPWNVMVLVAAYIVCSVALGLPIFGLIGDALLAIIYSIGKFQSPPGLLLFSLRYPAITFNQPIVFSLVGSLLQIADAFFFIYLGKQITRALRIAYKRPLTARHGKRTIVIVDNPTVHQLLESFVSKLYSQSYSAVSVDVHGASGLDHFVHRFTHRVVRGVLLAIGRPDGRLCCLAKSEASVLLAAKQAAFIKNPDYNYADGSGPEIVTVGHNPFEPSVGLSHHIVLMQNQNSYAAVDASYMSDATAHSTTAAAAAVNPGSSGANAGTETFSSRAMMSLKEDDSSSDGSNSHHDAAALAPRPTAAAAAAAAALITRQARRVRTTGRRKFVDEYLYDRLFLAQRPFTTSILRTLRQSFEQRSGVVKSCISSSSLHAVSHRQRASTLFSEATLSLHSYHEHSHHATAAAAIGASTGGASSGALQELLSDHLMPHGVHHIDPSILERSDCIESSVFADFVAANHDMLTKKVLERGIVKQKQKSNDPAVRLAFSSKLDQQTRQIQDLQVAVQQFYECRIASLERFMAFCVMFHAMAASSCQPWLSAPWDIARSQSNLRVATTASPIGATESAASSEGAAAAVDVPKFAHRLAARLRGFTANF